MVSRVGAVQIEGGEFSEEVVWGPPNLYVHLSCNSDVSDNKSRSTGGPGVIF